MTKTHKRTAFVANEVAHILALHADNGNFVSIF